MKIRLLSTALLAGLAFAQTANAQDFDDLRLGVRQHDGQRHLPVSGEAVALIRGGVFALPEQGLVGNDLRQRGGQFGLQGGRIAGGIGQRRIHGVSLIVITGRWGRGGRHYSPAAAPRGVLRTFAAMNLARANGQSGSSRCSTVQIADRGA